MKIIDLLSSAVQSPMVNVPANTAAAIKLNEKSYCLPQTAISIGLGMSLLQGYVTEPVYSEKQGLIVEKIKCFKHYISMNNRYYSLTKSTLNKRLAEIEALTNKSVLVA